MLAYNLLFFMSLYFFVAMHAWADKVAISAPVGCSNAVSCGQDTSLMEAKESFMKLDSDVANLKPFTIDHVCGDFSPADQYQWAPARVFLDGHAALKILQDHAKTGKPFNGYMVVESNDRKDSAQHLALCAVSQVADSFGPPRNCVTVGIITADETWLRGGNREKMECSKGRTTSFRSTGTINISFNVKTQAVPLKISAISKAILRTLEITFGLTADMKKSESSVIVIQSAGSFLDSKILSVGWRHSLDVDFTIIPGKNEIRITGIAFPQICRQASPNHTDYTGLNAAQQVAYAKELDAGVASAIQTVCDKFERSGTETITCN